MLFSDTKLTAAACLFEKSHGRRLAPSELAAVEEAGFASAKPDEIAEAIWRSLREAVPSDYRASAYWTLGKFARKEDKQRFISCLRVEVERDIYVAYQVMIALQNIDEPVFSRSGVSYNEDALNRRDALAYLATQR